MVRGQLSWRSTLRTTSSRGSEKERVLFRFDWLASEAVEGFLAVAVEERLGL